MNSEKKFHSVVAVNNRSRLNRSNSFFKTEQQCNAKIMRKRFVYLVTIAGILCMLLFASCGEDEALGFDAVTKADFVPPNFISALPVDGSEMAIEFDEPVAVESGKLIVNLNDAPVDLADISVQDNKVHIKFAAEMEGGRHYVLSGSVNDLHGNSTRFSTDFIGWNAHPAALLLSEIQSGTQSATLAGKSYIKHNDFIEFLCVQAGNLGGLELDYAGSVYHASYVFPPVNVQLGDYIVLHLAPSEDALEHAKEIDELGSDTNLAKAIDSSGARDLWFAGAKLSSTGNALILYTRPGGTVQDAYFYGYGDAVTKISGTKTGPVSGDIADLLATWQGLGVWEFGGSIAQWEDAHLFKIADSHSIAQITANLVIGKHPGKLGWHDSGSSGQTPGLPNP